jgi:hypothetical protein
MNLGELPALTNEPSKLVGGPTAAMVEPNCVLEIGNRLIGSWCD